MNWFKENPVLAAILAVAVLGTGVTGYLALQASSRHTLAVDDFNIQTSNLRRLQAKKPFPDSANADRVKTSVADYQKAIDEFKSHLAAMEAKLDTAITPQTFQDELRNAVDLLRDNAAKKGVALPEKFFFGFDDYQTQLPTQEETAALNREFLIIRNLLEKLVELPVVSIDSLVRHSSKETGPASAEAEPDQPAAGNEGEPAAPSFDSFTLALTASQEKFVAAFNTIPESGAFLVVRSMTLENTNPVPPPRVEPTPSTSSFPATLSTAENATESTEKLPVVFGREFVKATLLFEIPDFPGEPPAKEEKPNPASTN